MKFFLISCFVFFLASCVSTGVNQKQDQLPLQQNEPVIPTPQVGTTEENVDMAGLQNFLGLKRPYTKLGFVEKSFNSCQVGYGYSNSHSCRKLFLIVLNYQLMCRNTEGTPTHAVTAQDLRPISLKRVKWNLKNAQGYVDTDSEGYSQIVMVSDESQKYQRLRITIGEDFFFMKAGELTQMITPKSWCDL